MQVQLIKKLSSQVFIGQCVHSNAILRFEIPTQSARQMPRTVGVSDEFALTDCQFVAATKMIKCELLGANADDHGQTADDHGQNDGQTYGEHAEARKHTSGHKRPRLDIGACV